jgi:hypothetical protein
MSSFVALAILAVQATGPRVFTPAQVVQQQLQGRLCVEFRVHAAGRTTSPVKPGERPALLLQADQAPTRPDQFLAFLVGPTTAELQAKFGADLQKLFLGKTVRVTGNVSKAPIDGGTAYQLAVNTSKDIEIVKSTEPPDGGAAAPGDATAAPKKAEPARRRTGALPAVQELGGKGVYDLGKAKRKNKPGVAEYLTEDGKLKAAVTLRTGAHGLVPVGGPKAEVWRVEPNGEWTRQLAVRGKLRTEAEAKLSAEQLAALAQQLAIQDFKSLPRSQGYKQQAVDEIYLYIAIGFGNKEAEINFKVGETPGDYRPKPGDPAAGAWSRFLALQYVLADLLGIAELREKKGK